VRGFYTLRVDSNTIKEAATAAEEADREFDRMNLAALYETNKRRTPLDNGKSFWLLPMWLR
jgi:hypothetical protein